MDWIDEIYDRTSFAVAALGILGEKHTIEELLTRTTKNTRSGNEFGFKPRAMSVGVEVGQQYFRGFETAVEPKGINPHTEKDLPSSFWIRFKEEVCLADTDTDAVHLILTSCAGYNQWFQIRVFCTGFTDLTYAPYECRIPFRDVIPGGIKLRAEYRKDCDRVTAVVSIKARRPPRYTHYLTSVITTGGVFFDRHATEADFRRPLVSELYAGVIHAIEDPKLAINVGFSVVLAVT